MGDVADSITDTQSSEQQAKAAIRSEYGPVLENQKITDITHRRGDEFVVTTVPTDDHLAELQDVDPAVSVSPTNDLILTLDVGE